MHALTHILTHLSPIYVLTRSPPTHPLTQSDVLDVLEDMVLNFSRHPQLATVEGYKYVRPPTPSSIHPSIHPSMHLIIQSPNLSPSSHPPFLCPLIHLPIHSSNRPPTTRSYRHHTPPTSFHLSSLDSHFVHNHPMFQYQCSRSKPLPQPGPHGT